VIEAIRGEKTFSQLGFRFAVDPNPDREMEEGGAGADAGTAH
jgi:hypothetical protein